MLADTRDSNSLSSRMRRKRDVRLRALIRQVAAERGSVRILDMGGTVTYWQRVGVDFLRDARATVTVTNLLSSELEDKTTDADVFSTAVGDGCNLENVGDNEYDIAHSNSVIEHVYTWDNMKRFARETRRVAPYYYVQTPYFWFPVDPHYYKLPLFHFFPRPIRAVLLNTFPIAYSGRVQGVDKAFQIVDAARLLDYRQFRFLFPDAGIAFERFIGLKKSLLAIKAPAALQRTP